MKKMYNAPVSDIVMFDSADVITTSGGRINGTDRPATDFTWATDSNGHTYATGTNY